MSRQWRDLNDRIARDLRLNTSSVSLVELAVELGFTDSAAFQRAFKTWTGSPPAAYRRERAGTR
jgi:AraC-like DNA-binding protein